MKTNLMHLLDALKQTNEQYHHTHVFISTNCSHGVAARKLMREYNYAVCATTRNNINKYISEKMNLYARGRGERHIEKLMEFKNMHAILNQR